MYSRPYFKSLLAIGMLTLVAGACSETDKTAPPAPLVDPVASPTSISTQIITGSAEYGSTVKIKSSIEEIQVQADVFTALFRAEIKLNDAITTPGTQALTTLSVSATDDAGNQSEATVVEIFYEESKDPGFPETEGLSLELSKDIITTDEAEIIATARIGYDESADLSGQDILFKLSGIEGLDAAASEQVVVTNSSGMAQATFSDLTTASQNATITASTGDYLKSRSFQIVDEQARFIELSLSLDTIFVGNTVTASSVVKDAYGTIITSPAPTLSIASQDPAATDFYSQVDDDFTITQAGVYTITSTFDDGTHPAASDSKTILVEIMQDIEAPTVSITRINGYSICPNSGLLTDQADLSDCDSRTEPAAIFPYNSFVMLEITARDNSNISEVAYRAVGSGTAQDDFTLITEGDYLAGDDYIASFSLVLHTNWLSDVSIIAQATDTSGNSSNSSAVSLRVAFGPATDSDRSFEVLAKGEFLSQPRDITVAANGDILIANKDDALPFIYKIWKTSGVVSTLLELDSECPEFVSVDSDNNLYITIDALREVWQTPEGQSQSSLFIDTLSNPEGLSTTGAQAARGGWRFASNLAINACISIQIGTSNNPQSTRADSYIIQISDNCNGTSCVGNNGTGLLETLTPDICLTSTGADIPGDVRDHLNTVRETTGMSAFLGDDCFETVNECLFLVADEAGRQPQPVQLDSIVLDCSANNWVARNIEDGMNDSALYVVNRDNDRVYEFQTPSYTTANEYLFPAAGTLINVDAPARLPELDMAIDATLAKRLFLYAIDEASDRIHTYDSGRGDYRILAAAASGLNNPYGIAYIPRDDADNNGTPGGNCIVVTSRGADSDELRAYTDIDNLSGATLEGNGPMVSGFERLRGLALDSTSSDPSEWTLLVTDEDLQAVIRIGRSPNPDDCF